MIPKKLELGDNDNFERKNGKFEDSKAELYENSLYSYMVTKYVGTLLIEEDICVQPVLGMDQSVQLAIGGNQGFQPVLKETKQHG